MNATGDRQLGQFRNKEGEELFFDYVPPRPHPAVLHVNDFEGSTVELVRGVPVVIFVKDGRPVRAAFLQ